jgi:hypothetical protein
MTEQLSQIGIRLSETGTTSHQLQVLFKALNGQSLITNLTFNRNSGSNGNFLTVELPLAATQIADKLISAQQNLYLHTHISISTAETLLGIRELLRSPVQITVTPQLQNNRVSLLLNSQPYDLVKPNLITSQNFKLLLLELASVLAQPRPIVAYKIAKAPLITITQANSDKTPLTNMPPESASAKNFLLRQSVQDVIHKTNNPFSGSKSAEATQDKMTASNSDRNVPVNVVKTSTQSSFLIRQRLQRSSELPSLREPPQDNQRPVTTALPPQKNIEFYQQLQSKNLSYSNITENAAVKFKQLLAQDVTKQKPIHQALNSIRTMLPNLTESLGTSKHKLTPLLETLNSIPQPHHLTAESLQSLIRHSGVFRELYLARMLNPLLNITGTNSSEGSNATPKISELKNLLDSLLMTSSSGKLTHSNVTMNPTLVNISGDIKHLLSQIQYLITLGTVSASVDTNSKGLALLQNVFASLNLRHTEKKTLPEKTSPQVIKLLTEIESGLSRTRMIQHINLNHDLGTPQPWLFEIPLMHGKDFSSLQLKFEHEQDSSNKVKTRTWRVTIRFDLENLGAFCALAELKSQEINVRFFAEQEQTLSLLEQHLERLEKSLDEIGLKLHRGPSSVRAVPSLIPNTLGEQMLDVTI